MPTEKKVNTPANFCSVLSGRCVVVLDTLFALGKSIALSLYKIATTISRVFCAMLLDPWVNFTIQFHNPHKVGTLSARELALSRDDASPPIPILSKYSDINKADGEDLPLYGDLDALPDEQKDHLTVEAILNKNDSLLSELGKAGVNFRKNFHVYYSSKPISAWKLALSGEDALSLIPILSKHSNINEADGGDLPLHIAIEGTLPGSSTEEAMEHVDSSLLKIDALIEHGAAINAQDLEGNNAAHKLARCFNSLNNERAVKKVWDFLLEKGVFVDSVNFQGQTAQQLLDARKKELREQANRQK